MGIQKIAAFAFDNKGGNPAGVVLCDKLPPEETMLRIGGVFEDPATGTAAAALAGYLRDIDWGGGNNFEILQGFDMGIPSRLLVNFGNPLGGGITVSGDTRKIE